MDADSYYILKFHKSKHILGYCQIIFLDAVQMRWAMLSISDLVLNQKV